MYIRNDLSYKIQNDLCIADGDREILIIEFLTKSMKIIIVSCCYKPLDGNQKIHSYLLQEILKNATVEKNFTFLQEILTSTAQNLTHGQCKNSQVASQPSFSYLISYIITLLGPWICLIPRLLDNQIIRSLGHQIIRSLDCQIIRSLDFKIVRSLDHQII